MYMFRFGATATLSMIRSAKAENGKPIEKSQDEWCKISGGVDAGGLPG